MLGEMADELLLGGARVRATVLEQTGIQWADPELDQALLRILS
jgi:NAD dependent epimerase/dehydratase family enzyme